MKTMMKLVALTLAVMITLCSVALADTTVTTPGDSGTDVKATYEAQTNLNAVYYVTLYWGNMEFTVSENPANYVWNPATHSYGFTVKMQLIITFGILLQAETYLM